MIIQTENEDFLRDINSRALINSNVKALQEYKEKRRRQKKLDVLEEDVDQLKKDTQEIKSLLKELLNR